MYLKFTLIKEVPDLIEISLFFVTLVHICTKE